ncbi:molybdenum cofactor guanylyltransferase [Sinomicrobium kalidii]|uniref:molybdenum cofactor guanylyltransferase n=1 Tax=Sinomicrobium kalidii TaxID=2900738 RepID=UPI001E33A565|nr:molybdenum cofactor guanylyltransferase [Sinomicrobium kalidii]UGU16898.1 molybdenum cofactor guanylyltransferase [Sinomicrobium kalidii]
MTNLAGDISTYILCGGKSRRMGSEKGLVVFNGRTFVGHIFEAIIPVCDRVFLVTNSGNREAYGYPDTITDIYADKGPIGGIYTALQHSDTEDNLILSCDVPLLTTGLLRELMVWHRNGTAAITVVRDSDRIHPLIGIYKKKTRHLFKAALLQNELRLMKVLERINCQQLPVSGERSIELQNINTREDLQIVL